MADSGVFELEVEHRSLDRFENVNGKQSPVNEHRKRKPVFVEDNVSYAEALKQVRQVECSHCRSCPEPCAGLYG